MAGVDGRVMDTLSREAVAADGEAGTGKTLSLICSSLHWLEDWRRRQEELAAAPTATASASQGVTSEDDEPDWLRDYAADKEKQAQREAEERRATRLAAVRAGLVQRQSKALLQTWQKQAGGAPADPDAEFLLEEDASSDSGAAGPGSAAKRRRLSIDGHGSAAAGSRRGLELTSDSEADEEGAGEGLGEEAGVALPKKTQVIFSSRTHSQLSQFVGELRRTRFKDSQSLVALASRKALCINDTVLALGAPSLINERCLELQRSKSSSKKQDGKKSGRCPYLSCGADSAVGMHDRILAQPMDIEELAVLGRRKGVCPYYAARRALPEADVVLAPYASLLGAEAREALGLSVEGNVVIVDEAHNLAPASLLLGQLTAAVGKAAAASLPHTAFCAKQPGVLDKKLLPKQGSKQKAAAGKPLSLRQRDAAVVAHFQQALNPDSSVGLAV
ncbi:hypothetical protein N2152v2_002266 [Parachlorella kessleri]